MNITKAEFDLLKARVLQCDRAYLYAHPEVGLTPEQQTQLGHWVKRREQGEPIAYILGEKEFWSLIFKVTPDVLIPRPETELLVEQALSLLPHDQSVHIADIGTGSGAIACAIAYERPNWHVTATDKSIKALSVAQENATRLDLEHITFALGDLTQALVSPKVDIIISNLPYVAQHDHCLSEGDVRFEPQGALVGGVTGLECIARLIETAGMYLNKGGYLLLEHGCDQGDKVRQLLDRYGFNAVKGFSDLSGFDRASLAQQGNSL